MAAGPQQAMHLAQRGSVILDMFEYVEHAGGGDAIRRQARIFQPRADHRIDAAGMRGQGSVNSRLEQHAAHAGTGQALGDVAVAAADIEKHVVLGEAAHNGNNAAVSMTEPERAVLKHETRRIALVGIGDRGLIAPEPDAALTPFQARTGRCEIGKTSGRSIHQDRHPAAALKATPTTISVTPTTCNMERLSRNNTTLANGTKTKVNAMKGYAIVRGVRWIASDHATLAPTAAA